VDSWEIWTEITNDNGSKSYRSHHGKFLSAQPDTTFIADRQDALEWEQFTVEDQGNGRYTLRSCHGLFLSADNGGCVAREEVGDCEIFELRWLPNTVAIRCVHEDKTLTAEENGNPIFIRPEIDSWERWEESYNADGSRSYKSAHGKYLSAQPDGTFIADRDACNDWEKFTVEEIGDGRFSIKSIHGHYLSAQPDGTFQTREEVNEWEGFAIEMA